MADSVFGTMLETAQGLQGLGLRQRQMQAFDAEQAALQRQRETELTRRRAFSDDVNAALQDPQQMPALMLKYPEYADKVGKGISMLDEQTKNRMLNSNAAIVQMLDAGNIEGAKQTVQQNIDLYRTMPPAVLGNPKLFRGAVLTQLSADPNGREIIKQLGAAPITEEQRISRERLTFERGKEDFDQWAKRQEIDIKRLDSSIARETNQIKRDELIAQRDAKQQERQQAQSDRQASFEATAADFDNALSTIGEIETSPGLSAATGLTGAVARRIPGTDAYNVSAQIQTLKSQAFLTSVAKMKGTGALSENEGKKLESAIAALDPNMDEKAFRSELTKIKNITSIGRKRLEKQYGQAIPESGSVMFQGKLLTPSALRGAAKKAGMSVDEFKKAIGAQ